MKPSSINRKKRRREDDKMGDECQKESFKRINVRLLAMIKEIYLVEGTCRNFNDGRDFARSLLWIYKKCIGLQKLQLGWCASLLNADIFSLVQENVRLLHLSMSFNPILISDVGIIMLARFELQQLELSLFKNITFNGLREFLTKCKSVRYLTIHMCGCIDDESLNILRKLFPHVRITVPRDEANFMFIEEKFCGVDDEDIPSSDNDSDSKYLFTTDNSNELSSAGLSSDVDEDMPDFGGSHLERIVRRRNRNGSAPVYNDCVHEGEGATEDETSNDYDFRPSDNEQEVSPVNGEDGENTEKEEEDEE